MIVKKTGNVGRSTDPTKLLSTASLEEQIKFYLPKHQPEMKLKIKELGLADLMALQKELEQRIKKLDTEEYHYLGVDFEKYQQAQKKRDESPYPEKLKRVKREIENRIYYV